MEQIIKVGTSGGGACAKAIVAWNEKTKIKEQVFEYIQLQHLKL